ELGPQVDAVLELLGAVVAHGAPFDAATTRRRFVIACPDAISTLVADRLLESFRTEAPQATFSLRYVILDRALNGVRRGEIDLAIGVFGDIPASLSATTLYRDHYCVLARRGHPEVSGALDRASYRRLGHVFVGTPDTLVDELPIDRATMDATYGGLPTPEQVRTHGYVSQWETAMLLAARSDILVDCPRRLAERFAEPLGLQVLEPPFGRFEMHVQAVRRSTTDPATAWLLEKVAAAAA
ncbi:MAG TPA: LysR substrate-binding domain-containing protein, partial [Phenylobacterium sp.]